MYHIFNLAIVMWYGIVATFACYHMFPMCQMLCKPLQLATPPDIFYFFFVFLIPGLRSDRSTKIVFTIIY